MSIRFVPFALFASISLGFVAAPVALAGVPISLSEGDEADPAVEEEDPFGLEGELVRGGVTLDTAEQTRVDLPVLSEDLDLDEPDDLLFDDLPEEEDLPEDVTLPEALDPPEELVMEERAPISVDLSELEDLELPEDSALTEEPDEPEAPPMGLPLSS